MSRLGWIVAAGVVGIAVSAGAEIRIADSIQRVPWKGQALLVGEAAPGTWDAALITLQTGQVVLGRILHVQSGSEERVACWPVDGDRSTPPSATYRMEEVVTMKRAVGVLF